MNLTNNVEILHEDEHILVCKKPPGLATQTQSSRNPDMVSVLKRYLYNKNPKLGEPYVAVIHRLDQPVGGLLVFAKTPLAAKILSMDMQNHNFQKHYAALLTTTPESRRGTWEHYMVKDSSTNSSHICSKDTPGSKYACLHYEVGGDADIIKLFSHITSEFNDVCLVKIQLKTGRHHQIRVQTSAMGCSIMGDTKYGSGTNNNWQQIALCAYKLIFNHPVTKNKMEFML